MTSDAVVFRMPSEAVRRLSRDATTVLNTKRDMPNESEMVTCLLAEMGSRPAAAGELLPLVYDQLRGIAAQRMREERSSHTLQPTALVHEAYVRLASSANQSWEGRAHFFRTAAEAMRRILIDHARRRTADKRGGGAARASLENLEIAVDPETHPEALLALEQALETLKQEDPRVAEVIQLRFFAGLGFADIARLMNVSERTILREWAFARARLVELIEGTAESN